MEEKKNNELLEQIAKDVHKISFWVRFFSILTVSAVILVGILYAYWNL